jgi:hypothetical protein
MPSDGLMSAPSPKRFCRIAELACIKRPIVALCRLCMRHLASPSPLVWIGSRTFQKELTRLEASSDGGQGLSIFNLMHVASLSHSSQ